MTTTAEHQTVSWACPDADLVIRADATRDEWLAQRRRGIGGSDASTVAGVNPYSSRYELWLEKTGRAAGKPETPQMRMGTLLEPIIADCFTDTTGIQVRRAGLMASKTRPWQLVSVDRLTADGGLLECKKTNWRLADQWDDDQVADHAEIQVQHALAVTGRKHAWVAVMIDGGYPQFRRVERDEELIATLTEMEETFWFQHVIAGVAPDITEPAALDTVKNRYPREEAPIVAAGTDGAAAFTIWQHKRRARLQAEAEEKVAEAVLRDLIGAGGGLAVHGDTLVTCKQNGAFSTSRFTADHPAIAAEYVTTKPVLDVDRIKHDHPKLHTAYRARVLRPVSTTKGK